MSEIQQRASELTTEIKSAFAQVGKVPLADLTPRILGRIETEAEEIRWQHRVALADADVSARRASLFREQLANTESKIEGAIEEGADDLAAALMKQQDNLREALFKEEETANKIKFLASELGAYSTVLSRLEISTRGELRSLQAQAQAAEVQAMLTRSYKVLRSVTETLEKIHDSVEWAESYGRAERNQALSENCDLHIELLEEEARESKYRRRIDKIRHRQSEL